MRMTQIKIFSETTYESRQPADAMTIEKLQKKINNFLEENDGKIIVKDIKYKVQSPNPHQSFVLQTKFWTVMIIYDVKG